MTSETYTELEVLAIMRSMVDLNRSHPNAHYAIERDPRTGRIVGWKLSELQPAAPPRPDPSMNPSVDDRGRAPGDSSGVFDPLGGYGLWFVMAWVLLVLGLAAAAVIHEAL